MTYENAASAPHGPYGRNYRNEWTDWATTPGFHPGKVLAVIAGFAVFPPLGVLALGYFIWNSRRGRWSENGERHGWRGGCGHKRRGFTGNRAFDEHSAKVLDDLAAEREAFFAYRKEERMKRDRAEYENFKNQAEKSDD